MDAAIAAASAPEEVRLAEVPIRIASTGRIVILHVPADLLESELAEVCGWMLTSLLLQVRAIPRGPRLEVARSMPGPQ